MSQNTHELILFGDKWEDKQACWSNFVMRVMDTNNLYHLSVTDIMIIVNNELLKAGLRLEGKTLTGSEEDLTAWMLTYG